MATVGLPSVCDEAGGGEAGDEIGTGHTTRQYFAAIETLLSKPVSEASPETMALLGDYKDDLIDECDTLDFSCLSRPNILTPLTFKKFTKEHFDKLVEFEIIDLNNPSFLGEMNVEHISGISAEVWFYMFKQFDKERLIMWRDDEGNTLITLFYGHGFYYDTYIPMMIEYLIEECGMDPNTNNCSETFIDLCVRHGLGIFLTKLIVKYGADPRVRAEVRPNSMPIYSHQIGELREGYNIKFKGIDELFRKWALKSKLDYYDTIICHITCIFTDIAGLETYIDDDFDDDFDHFFTNVETSITKPDYNFRKTIILFGKIIKNMYFNELYSDLIDIIRSINTITCFGELTSLYPRFDIIIQKYKHVSSKTTKYWKKLKSIMDPYIDVKYCISYHSAQSLNSIFDTMRMIEEELSEGFIIDIKKHKDEWWVLWRTTVILVEHGYPIDREYYPGLSLRTIIRDTRFNTKYDKTIEELLISHIPGAHDEDEEE